MTKHIVSVSGNKSGKVKKNDKKYNALICTSKLLQCSVTARWAVLILNIYIYIPCQIKSQENNSKSIHEQLGHNNDLNENTNY